MRLQRFSLLRLRKSFTGLLQTRRNRISTRTGAPDDGSDRVAVEEVDRYIAQVARYIRKRDRPSPGPSSGAPSR